MKTNLAPSVVLASVIAQGKIKTALDMLPSSLLKIFLSGTDAYIIHIVSYP